MAQYNLGQAYEEGGGVSKSRVKAYTWYNLAAIKGDEDAIKARNNLASRMTDKQLEKAEKLCEKWVRKHGL